MNQGIPEHTGGASGTLQERELQDRFIWVQNVLKFISMQDLHEVHKKMCTIKNIGMDLKSFCIKISRPPRSTF